MISSILWANQSDECWHVKNARARRADREGTADVTYVREVVMKGCVEHARVRVWTGARNHATFQNDFPDISYTSDRAAFDFETAN